MTSPIASRFHSAMSPARKFSWRRHRITVALVLTGILGFRLSAYFGGRLFSGHNIFSPTMLFVVALMVLLPVLLLGTLGGLYQIFIRQVPRKNLRDLALPFAGIIAVLYLPIPRFDEAAASSLREKVSNTELTSLARSVIDPPPSEEADAPSRRFWSPGAKWFSSTPPLDRLGFRSSPMAEILNDTLIFHWGSSFSDHWGIAIAATPGMKPELPPDCRSSVAAYPDVWVFTLPE
jgi:hypothetical protein